MSLCVNAQPASPSARTAAVIVASPCRRPFVIEILLYQTIQFGNNILALEEEGWASRPFTSRFAAQTRRSATEGVLRLIPRRCTTLPLQRDFVRIRSFLEPGLLDDIIICATCTLDCHGQRTTTLL